MTTHYVQRPYECVLASAAQLAGIDYPTLRELFMAEFGETWTARIFRLKRHDIDERVRWLAEVTGLPVTYDWLVAPDGVITGAADAPPRAKKARLSITYPSGGSHAVSWIDGMIHDPDRPGPITWEEFRAYLRQRGAEISLIAVIEP